MGYMDNQRDRSIKVLSDAGATRRIVEAILQMISVLCLSPRSKGMAMVTAVVIVPSQPLHIFLTTLSPVDLPHRRQTANNTMHNVNDHSAVYGVVAPNNAVSAGPSGIASSAISTFDSSTGIGLLTNVEPSLGSEFIDMNSVWTGSFADARRRAERGAG
jgi:hypothetical protein